MEWFTQLTLFQAFTPGRDYNHADDQEYKRLRDLAEQEYHRKADCTSKSKQAYQRGDGAQAKQFSEQAKAHEQKMDQYNQQAADFVFRANNADSAPDEIDLHGLFVKEAIQVLDTRIRSGISRNESHIKAIVGKGNHSANHVAKIKPAVEELCQTHGIKHQVDPHNTGVIILYLNQQGGGYPQQPAPVAPGGANQYYGNAPQHQQYAPGPQANYGQQQQQQQQGQGNNDVLTNIFCGVIKLLFKQCS